MKCTQRIAGSSPAAIITIYFYFCYFGGVSIFAHHSLYAVPILVPVSYSYIISSILPEQHLDHDKKSLCCWYIFVGRFLTGLECVDDM
ncbi:hypothetical protein V8F33_003331 [Rhypophila sp. PSN 637]